MRRYIVQQRAPYFLRDLITPSFALESEKYPLFSDNFLMVFPSVHQKMTNDCSQLQISKNEVDDEMAISCLLAFSYILSARSLRALILVKVSTFNEPFAQMSSLHVPKCGPHVHPKPKVPWECPHNHFHFVPLALWLVVWYGGSYAHKR